MFDLEDNLPDELMAGGNSWSDQMLGNKPPNQGPGQMNGEDPNVVGNVAMRLQHQQLAHIMQSKNNQMLGGVNTLGLGQMGSKSPNLQSPPNVQSSMPNNIGSIVHSMSMSIANNGNTPMGMQCEYNL